VDAFAAPSPASTASPAKAESSGVIDLFGGAYLSSFSTYIIWSPFFVVVVVVLSGLSSSILILFASFDSHTAFVSYM
jgi:hypothetical protein